MKVFELLSPKPLLEGTWSLPDSHAAVMKVMKLLDGGPIKASDKAKRKQISSLLGSDSVFDDLDKAQDEKVQDIRPILIKHLPSFLDTRRWVQKPDDETQFAINMLRKKYGVKD